MQHDGYVTLQSGDTSLVISSAVGSRPSIIYYGTKLSDLAPDSLYLMQTRQNVHGGPDINISTSLLNETGAGLTGSDGFLAHRNGSDWASLFHVSNVECPTENSVIITCDDTVNHIQAMHLINLDPESTIMSYETRIINHGKTDLSIDWCAAANIPLDPRLIKLLAFTGRWAGEFSIEEIPSFTGSYVRENKNGRTGHNSFPALIAYTGETNEESGQAQGFHLGWSGNSRMRVDRLDDGRAFIQLGEAFYPGEMTLSPGDIYQSPTVYAGHTIAGFNGLSHKFHHHLRRSVMDGRIHKKPRPIHYNTWEAVYFDHDQDKLFALAETAARVGVERFILDDGWFSDRRHTKAGLGDWTPSEDCYPEGLGPIINHVRALGMEFGLWFEPEMVNPDSDLYRAHPDWILKVDGIEQIPFRNQYALNLTRKEVSDYLFDKIDHTLSTYDISYIKWDMNRDIHHPGSQGRAVSHKQTHEVYKLMDRLRQRHPFVEIESCASGGARADYGILRYSDRIWTSDSNDALDRQHIQRGASYFFPLEILGAHVGPETCHITGRRLTMELRIATAFFGHMGLEMDLLKETPQDLETLKAGISLHKKHRALLHKGNFHRLNTPEYINAVGIVDCDENEALFSWCILTGHRETLPARLFFSGLAPDKKYRVKIIWPAPVNSETSPSIIEAADLEGNGYIFPGEALMKIGLQTPKVNPETCLIYYLVCEN